MAICDDYLSRHPDIKERQSAVMHYGKCGLQAKMTVMSNMAVMVNRVVMPNMVVMPNIVFAKYGKHSFYAN